MGRLKTGDMRAKPETLERYEDYRIMMQCAMKDIMQQSGMTYRDIAQATGINISTVYEIFNSIRSGMSVLNVLPILEAMGYEINIEKKKVRHEDMPTSKTSKE